MAVKFQGGRAVPVEADRPSHVPASVWNQLLPKGQQEARSGKVPLLNPSFKNAVFNALELGRVIQMMEANATTPKAKAAVAELKALDNGLSSRIYAVVSKGFVWD